MKRGDVLPCGHSEPRIVEFGRAYTIHERGADGRWFHYSDTDDYTGTIEITCDECKHTWRFGTNPNRPKWAHDLWLAAAHDRTEPELA